MKNLKTFESFDDDEFDDDEFDDDELDEETGENIDGFTLDDLYELGSDTIREAADLLTNDSREDEEWNKINNSDPGDVIKSLRDLGTKSALSLAVQIENIENSISNFPN